MVDRLGPDVAGVTLDTGNLVMRLDDPVRAAERLAPHVLATHVKDAVLAVTPRGLCWQARPVGSGVLPIPDMLAPLLNARADLALSIELHPRTYDLPIHDPTWLAFFPALRPESLAAVVRLADRCEARYADGSLPGPRPSRPSPGPTATSTGSPAPSATSGPSSNRSRDWRAEVRGSGRGSEGSEASIRGRVVARPAGRCGPSIARSPLPRQSPSIGCWW